MSSPSPKTKTSRERRSQHPAGGSVRADLKAYLDGELSPVRRWLVRVHLGRCAACREEITWLQRLGKNMRSLEGARPRPELRSRILSTLPPMEPFPTHPTVTHRQSARPTLRLALSGGLLALFVGGVFAMTQYTAIHHNSVVSLLPHNVPVLPPNPTTSPNAIPVHAPVVATDSNRNNDPFAPPPDINKPDPTSIVAGKLVDADEVRLRKAEERRLPLKWSQTIAAVQNMKNREGVYIPVALTVSDMSAARQQLENWAHKTNSVMTVTPRSEGSIEVALHIPSGEGNALFAAMSHTGKVILLTSREGNSWVSPGKTVPVAVPMPVPDGNPSPPLTGSPGPSVSITPHSLISTASKAETAAKADKRIAVSVILVVANAISN